MNLLNRLLIFSTICLTMLSICGCDSSSDSVVEDTTTTDTVVQRTVYLLSNASGTNSVLAYTRDSAGGLTFSSETPTGGSGSGDDLGSSGGSIVLDTNTGLLYCVNAGSNSISLFYVYTDGTVALLDTQNTRGVRPISIAVDYDTVYVLNAGDADNAPTIAGFTVLDGALYFIEDSNQSLDSTDALPTQIAFAPAGGVLAVSESGSDQITSFVLDSNYAAYYKSSVTSAGLGPAGIDFTPGGVMLCAEINEALDGGGSVSSYSLSSLGDISAISSSATNGATSTTGIKVFSSGSNAVVSNSGSDNLSWYAIGSDGQVSYTGADFAAGDEPREVILSENDEYLYVLNRGSDSISVYAVDESGNTLTALSGVSGLPASTVGLTGW